MLASTAYRSEGYSSAIRAADTRVQDTEEQVTSGKRIEKPSDDPVGTQQLLSISTLRSQIASYTKNIGTAQDVLSSSESAYGDIGDLAASAQTLAIQGATSTMDQSDRDNVADQIQSLQDSLVSLGNTQASDGRYVFGGQVTDSAPFSVASDGTLTYSGNATAPTVQTGPNQTEQVGETGGTLSTLYANLSALQADLRSGNLDAISNTDLAAVKASGDAIASAQGNVGVRLDSIQATSTTLSQQDTDLQSRASDIGDVDYATAIVDYTAAQSTYQAALTVASKGFSMSLMDFMTTT